MSVVAAAETARVVANEATDRGQGVPGHRVDRAVHRGGRPVRGAAGWPDALAARATRRRDPGRHRRRGRARAGGPRSTRRCRVITVGHERDNQAIAALAVRADPSGLKRQLFVSVANYSDQVVPRRLQVLADGTPVTARDLRLAALSRTDVVIDELPRGARVDRGADHARGGRRPAHGSARRPTSSPLDDVGVGRSCPTTG